MDYIRYHLALAVYWLAFRIEGRHNRIANAMFDDMMHGLGIDA